MYTNATKAMHAVRDGARIDAEEVAGLPQFVTLVSTIHPEDENRRGAWHSVCQTLPMLHAMQELVRLGAPATPIVRATEAMAAQLVEDLYRAATGQPPVGVRVESDREGTRIVLVIRESMVGTSELDAADEWMPLFFEQVRGFPYRFDCEFQR